VAGNASEDMNVPSRTGLQLWQLLDLEDVILKTVDKTVYFTIRYDRRV